MLIFKETVEALLRGPLWLFYRHALGAGGCRLVAALWMWAVGAGFASVACLAPIVRRGPVTEQRKPLGIGIIRESMGQHWDVMGIAFWYWIVSMAFACGSLPSVLV